MDNQRTDQPSLFQSLQRHIYEQGLEVAVDLLFPVLVTILFAYINHVVKDSITPYLKQIAEKIQSDRKNRPTFNPDQEAKIKEYMRAMLAKSDIDRVSLFFLDNPHFHNGLIKADSFTLWIAAEKNIGSVNESNNELSFAFVSEEINRLAQNNQKIASYNKIKDGKVCLVFLEKRGTTGYSFYCTNEYGFLLIEKMGNGFRLFNNIKYFIGRKSLDYLDYCNKIDQIIGESAT